MEAGRLGRRLGVALLALVVARSASGEALSFRGELSFEVNALPSPVFRGQGIADADTFGSGHLSRINTERIFGTQSLSSPVTDPGAYPVVGVLATVAPPTGAFFSEGGGAAGRFGGSMQVRGFYKVCLYGTACSTALSNITVPLAVVGFRSDPPVPGFSTGRVNVTVTGAPWTVGTAVIGTATRMGSRRGPAFATSSTADAGGELNLVTPIVVSTNILSIPRLPLFGRLRLSFEGAPVSVSLTATPETVSSGQSATLQWTSNGATSCTASSAWSGARALSGSLLVTPPTTSTYTLTCQAAGGSASDSATITVVPRPTVTLTATPPQIATGSTSTLSWQVTNATSCQTTGSWSLSVVPVGGSASGSFAVSPAATSTYGLVCQNAAGASTTASASVQVVAPVSVSLTATPATLSGGQSSTLQWTSSGASSCAALGAWSGTRPLSGSLPVTPVATSTYTINCVGPGGAASDSATVTVVPRPTVTLTATPPQIATGSTSTLNWQVTNATSCQTTGAWTRSIVPVGGSASGSVSVSPTATSTYRLVCQNAAGASTTASASVQVVASVSVSLTATPGAVGRGQPATLQWTSSGAASCAASGAWSGGRALSGTLQVTPSATSTYTLTCQGAGGSAADSETVTVVGQPIVDLRAEPLVLARDRGPTSATLSWSVVGATSCEASEGWSGLRDPVGGSESVSPAQTRRFRLSCQHGEHTVYDDVVVSVQDMANGLPDLVPDLWREEDGSAQLICETVQVPDEADCAINPGLENCCALEHGLFSGTGTRTLLRFGTLAQNLGTADLRLGDPVGDPRFEPANCHGHWHFAEFASHRLVDGASNVVAGHKYGFCLTDLVPVPGYALPESSRIFTCRYQGIQKGYADLYTSTLDGQWVDITNVPPGTYELQVELDPDGALPESDASNNVVSIPVDTRALVCLPQGAPANDECQAATPIEPDADGLFFDALSATHATQNDLWDAQPTCTLGGRGPTVWYSFTAPADGGFAAIVSEPDYDTVLSIWNGECGALGPQLACNDDQRRGEPSSGSIAGTRVLKGERYLVQVGSYANLLPGGEALFGAAFASPEPGALAALAAIGTLALLARVGRGRVEPPRGSTFRLTRKRPRE